MRRAGVADGRAEAEWLLADLLGRDRGALYLARDTELDPAVEVALDARVRRRAAREPAQHVTGRVGFHGLVLRSDARALVPRPETEGLVDAVLGLLPADGGATVADLGTGSGCIAVTLAVARPAWRLLALERSPAALDLARLNAGEQGVDALIDWRLGDFGVPPADWRGRVDVVVSNPPYVAEADWETLEPEVRDHDPREALVGGADGLEAYRALVPAATELLAAGGSMARGGHLVLELGRGQSAAVAWIVEAAGFRVVEVRDDLAGIPRVLIAAWADGAGTAGGKESRG